MTKSQTCLHCFQMPLSLNQTKDLHTWEITTRTLNQILGCCQLLCCLRTGFIDFDFEL